ncbi:MAG: hypothetical protein ACJ72B_17250 [Ornithinibacter sp.]
MTDLGPDDAAPLPEQAARESGQAERRSEQAACESGQSERRSGQAGEQRSPAPRRPRRRAERAGTNPSADDAPDVLAPREEPKPGESQHDRWLREQRPPHWE